MTDSGDVPPKQLASMFAVVVLFFMGFFSLVFGLAQLLLFRAYEMGAVGWQTNLTAEYGEFGALLIFSSAIVLWLAAYGLSRWTV